MLRFGSERITNILEGAGLDEDLAIESKILTRAVESAQKLVEGNNYDSRKTVLEYDDVVRIQREIVYGQRLTILSTNDLESIINDMMFESINRLTNRFTSEEDSLGQINTENYINYLNQNFFIDSPLQESMIKERTGQEITEFILERIHHLNEERKQILDNEGYLLFLRGIVLQVIDKNWMQHIDDMSGLRQGISWRSYGQVNPLLAYREEGMDLFNLMIENIQDEITVNIARAIIKVEVETAEE